MNAFIYLMDFIYLNHRYFGYCFVPLLSRVVEACLFNRLFSVLHLCHWLSLVVRGCRYLNNLYMSQRK